MSLLPLKTSINKTQLAFVPYFSTAKLNASSISTGDIVANTANISSLIAEFISTEQLFADTGTFSTFSTSQIVIDSQTLNATPTELLLNGVPVATLSSLSSIADWSLEPAISTIQMAGNDLDQGGTLSSFNVRAGNGFFLNLVAFNSLFVSSNTSTISSLINSADLGIFSTLNAGVISSGAISSATASISSLTSDEILIPGGQAITLQNAGASFVSPGSAQLAFNWDATGNLGTHFFYDTNLSSVRVMTKNPGGYVDNPASRLHVPVIGVSSLSVSSIQGAVVSSINGDTGTFSTLNASTLNAGNISTGVIAADTNMLMTAERFSTIADNGVDILNKAKISFDALNGLNGEINLSARPGNAGIGGTINLLAEGGVTPLGVGYGGEVNITATTGGFTSLALTSAVNLNAAGINSYAGAITPVGSVAGYNFIHGDVGVNLTAGAPSFIPNDPLTLYLYGTNGTLMFGTQYIQGPIRPYSDLTTNPADLYIEDYSNLITRGYVQLRGVSTQTFKGGDTAILGVNRIQFSTAGGALENVSTLNGLPVTAYENVSSFADLSVSSLVVSSINGLNVASLENISTFNTLAASSITTSSISTAIILGANDNLFGLGIQGLEIQTSPTGQVWISSPQTNIAGLVNSSTITALQVQGRAAFLSSATISSCFTSTLAIAGLSSIVLSTSGTAGLAAQPAGRLMLGGNDLDLGQQDLWAQQVRVGAGNPGGSAQTEVIWYSPDNLTIRGLGLGGSDLTLRIQSTINSGANNGYLLDTTINRPFFSTINNSTCLMASYPSTTLGNFGVSTLAVIPPIQVYGGFYSSTTQVVAGANTITPLTYTSESVNVGGITFAGSTISVPSAGTYEITHSIQFDTTSGGTNEAFFWVKKNGTDIPQSASIVSVVNNGETLGTISLLDTAAAGDQYAVCIASADANMRAAAFPVSSFCPAIPAVITNIKRLG